MSLASEDGRTRSPQIVRRAHVRTRCRILIDAFHVSDPAMSRINRDFCRNSGIRMPGTWKRSDVDLKRYGVGGLDVIVYAMMFLTGLDEQYETPCNVTYPG